MKLSMWIILDRLDKYHPIPSIQEGAMCITGVRFTTEADDLPHPSQYVYLYQDAARENGPAVRIKLTNGIDSITFRDCDSNGLLNDLLGIFDFYNAWETSLWAAASHKSVQKIIDIADTVLNNPILISDMDGNVLAMSSAFVNQNLSIYWNESRDSNHVPDAISGAPLHRMTGEAGAWTDTPDLYIMPGGRKLIGTFLKADGERIAGFGVWEYRRPIVPSDISLVQMVCDVLLATIDAHKHSFPLYSSAALIADLLSGEPIDDELINTIDFKCRRPWQLIRIVNPFRSDEINQRNLVQRLWMAKYPCVPLIYGSAIIVLASQSEVQPLLDTVIDAQQNSYNQTSISLPFEDPHHIRILYEQTLYMAQQAGGIPGIYRGEDYAFSYLLSVLQKDDQIHALLHPGLTHLKQYDTAKQSNLGETLYQYLLYERSIQMGAQAMYVHKNTFTYRLERARALANVDLENPASRIYLLLSYLISGYSP